jgi:hypothetical protein
MNARDMQGEIRVSRSYDIRIDPKTGQKTEVSPDVCMCCKKDIFHITELSNGDIVGPGCDGLIAYPAYRIGRTLSSKQADYARSRGLLPKGSTR